jgi:hypothetical protein
MTAPSSTAPIRIDDDGGYQPGVCNIGRWEIRRRRASAIVAFVIGLGALALMVAGGVPAPVRLVLVFPFWGGALAWLQARRRFCAGFAMGGLSNFGDGGATRKQVTDPAAHHQDMLAVLRLTRDSFVIGLALALVAVLLPR